MKFLKTSTLFTFALLMSVLSQKSVGQGLFSKKNILNQYSSVGIGGGTSNYFGDLSPYGTFYYGLITNVRWNATIDYTKYITPNFGLRFGFTWARIAGDDFNYSQHNLDKFYLSYFRNLSFRNDIKEFTIQGIFNLIQQDGKSTQLRGKFVPYAFGGFGFYGHNPEARLPATTDALGNVTLGNWVSLRSYATAGQGLGANYPKPYSLVQVVIPLGLGVRYRINDKFDLSAELGYRFTPTDYLDDVGGDKYANPADLLTPTAQDLANRSQEDIAANSGTSRIPVYQDIYLNVLSSGSATGLKPSLNTDVGYSLGSSRGTGGSGMARWDNYLLTQFTIHYIISNEIKCPPIR